MEQRGWMDRANDKTEKNQLKEFTCPKHDQTCQEDV